MELKHPFKTLGAAAAAGLLSALALGAPAYAEVVNIPINPGNVPTTAAGFEDQSCDQVPDDKALWEDGWVFVLPAAAGAEGNFETVYATFEDELGVEHELNTDDDGGVVNEVQGDNKAYILTPGGWTLVDATADVNDPDDGAQFNLTHACAAEGEVPEEVPSLGEETPSEAESPAMGDESPSCPEESTSSVDESGATTDAATDEAGSAPEESSTPCEEATTPAGSTLPTTGAPLTIALVSAAALAAGGAALFMVMRRRRAAQDW